MHRWKEKLLVFMLSAFVVAGALLAAEVLARRHRGWYYEIFEYDQDKLRRLKSNYCGQFAGKTVQTNSFGYRDAEVPVAKPSGTRRILVVGDSIAFGHGVNGEETFAEVLERELNAQKPGNAVDVINTAAPGNSPFQEYYDLQRGLCFSPDLVIVQFALNDILEPSLLLKNFGGKGMDSRGIIDIPYYEHVLSQKSAFYLYLKDLVRNKLNGRRSRQRHIRQETQQARRLVFHPEDPHIQEAWKEYFRWMDKMTALCKEKNIPVILLASPFNFQIDLANDPNNPQRSLGKYASDKGIQYLDLLAVLHDEARVRGIPGKDLWREYFIDYDHYSVQGHKRVARLLLDRLAVMKWGRAGRKEGLQ